MCSAVLKLAASVGLLFGGASLDRRCFRRCCLARLVGWGVMCRGCGASVIARVPRIAFGRSFARPARIRYWISHNACVWRFFRCTVVDGNNEVSWFGVDPVLVEHSAS